MTEQNLNIRLSLLEADMKRANNSLIKIEQNAEKHREAHSQITEKIYGRMEDLRTELKEDIATIKTELQEQIKNQNELLHDISNKLNDLDKWRWIIVGIASAVGYIISKVTDVFHF